jgi:hypothetical protein
MPLTCGYAIQAIQCHNGTMAIGTRIIAGGVAWGGVRDWQGSSVMPLWWPWLSACRVPLCLGGGPRADYSREPEGQKSLAFIKAIAEQRGQD